MNSLSRLLGWKSLGVLVNKRRSGAVAGGGGGAVGLPMIGLRRRGQALEGATKHNCARAR